MNKFSPRKSLTYTEKKRYSPLKKALAYKPSETIMKLRFFHKAKELAPRTGFTQLEVEGLLRMYDKVCEKYQSLMTKAIFKDVLFNFFGLSIDILMDKVFRILRPGNSNYLTHDEWILGMHIYLRASFVERVYFAFSVYDFPQKRFLKKDDIQLYFKDCMVIKAPEDDPEEYYHDLIEFALTLMDRDKDGVISQQDFVDSVILEPLLMEVFGDCMPNANSAQALEILFRQNSKETETFSYQQNPLLLDLVKTQN